MIAYTILYYIDIIKTYCIILYIQYLYTIKYDIFIYIYIWIGALSKEIFLPKHPNGKKLVNLIIPPLFLQLTTHCPCWDHDWYRATRIQQRHIPSHLQPISSDFRPKKVCLPRTLDSDACTETQGRDPQTCRASNINGLKAVQQWSHPKKEHILALHIHYCLICFTKLDSGTPKW